jgi:hypothetical protein
MRAAAAFFVVGLAACSSPPSTPGTELWVGPGENEQNYVLTATKPSPY